MNIWVLSMWVIASLMACWSFSLFVRWVSEAVARKRKGLVSQRTTKSFWFGFVLMIVCAGIAAFAGAMGIYLEGQFTHPRQQWTTPIAIIGGSIGVFGIFLLIMAIVGDRARGRMRCPRCWYDMSDAIGLQCPECGHTAKNEAKFSKSRHLKRTAIAGVVLIGVGVYPVILNKKTVKYGPLAMMPTWVLMNWWEELPEEWIVRRWGSGHPGALQDRIQNKWMSAPRIERFGNSLAKPMMTSKTARWDPTRIQLLIRVYAPSASNEKRKEWGLPPKPTAINLEELLEILAFDQLEALTTESPSSVDAAILDCRTSLRFSYQMLPSTYEIVRHWIVGYEDHKQTNGYGSIRFHLREDSPVTEHLGRFAQTLKDTDLSESLLNENNDISTSAFRLVTDTNSLADYFELYINAPIPQDFRSFSKHLSRTTYACFVVMDNSKDEIYATLNDWLSDDNHRRVALGIGVTEGLRRLMKLDHTSEDEPYQEIVDRIWSEALDDPRILYPDGPYKSQSVSLYAQKLILKHMNDPVGDVVFPMIQDWLENNGNAYWTTGLHRNPSEETIRIWLEHFEKFAYSPNPMTRKWVVNNLPMGTKSAYEERINQLVILLAGDANSEVAKDAQRTSRTRGISHLLSD